jgi:YidC/Oxa1 family membrane protein insertase
MEMAKLYKKHGINPLSGCLPMLIQIPIFFALYKVLIISIELRHAPFFGWITDLSVPDPTNIFGLLPFTPPAFMHVGAWPVIMGLTMFLQQRLVSGGMPAHPSAAVLKWLPLIFTFMLAAVPAGIIVYWTFSNLITIVQQYLIIRKPPVLAPA